MTKLPRFGSTWAGAWLVCGCALLVLGCSSQEVHERGWIGGQFETVSAGWWSSSNAVPAEKLGQKGAVLVTEVYSDTPLEQAGAQTGDVILEWGGETLKRKRDLRRQLDEVSPGTAVPVRILRAGEVMELPVTVGRERYQRYGTLKLGLSLSSQLDLFPNPDFNILGLLSFARSRERLELRSPRVRLGRWAYDRETESVRSTEGYGFWFLLFGLGRHKVVVSQECFDPEAEAAVQMGEVRQLGE